MDEISKKTSVCDIITDLEKAKNFILHEEFKAGPQKAYTEKFITRLLTECCWQFLWAINRLECKIKHLESEFDRNILLSRETFTAIPAAFAEIEDMLGTVVEALKPFANCVNDDGQMQEIIHLSQNDFKKAAESIRKIQSLKGWTDKINLPDTDS